MYLQSIELEREPYESEVQAEIKQHEDDMRAVAKKQRTSIVPRDLNTEEEISKLELRVRESEDDIVHLKQEIRNALFEISTMTDACREPVAVESTTVGELGIRHGSAHKGHGHGAQNGESSALQ
jgi:septal ring factor EnvC (AmiA/AmiB activator)